MKYVHLRTKCLCGKEIFWIHPVQNFPLKKGDESQIVCTNCQRWHTITLDSKLEVLCDPDTGKAVTEERSEEFGSLN